ncbi:unnamed protein product [Prorocentrum cordatum]|uniref:Fatty acid desaturase domain-containing protein n=1 Tax=Prorocentrum cordatum TaxID=2364126 RepID=A0ABN9UMA0_9DINO|nr:unnamed protein product [Polarella glacialis]
MFQSADQASVMADAKTYVLKDLDADAFHADLLAAKAAVGEATEADARHLQGIVRAMHVLLYGGHALLFLGTAQAWGLSAAATCLLAAAMISTGRCMRWTIVGHHVMHGGYDKLQRSRPGCLEPQYKRGVFAMGARRVLDWMDWMLPEAWDAEHNSMHHLYLSENKDPDLVENNFSMMHSLPIPKVLKYLSMLGWMASWKYAYYSPNTFKELQFACKGSWLTKRWPASTSREKPLVLTHIVFENPARALLRGAFGELAFWACFLLLWLGVVVPMAAMVALPAATPLLLSTVGAWPFAAAPADAAWRALAVAALAESLTNAHSFIIIACNHAGEDLYRYETSCKAYTAEWFCRCAHSSVNFECGNDLIDSLYGWLNYQIEHHMFPDMSLLQYRKLQPLVQSICKKHGVLYVQQNALRRMWQMFRIAAGDAKMIRCTALIPPKVESAGVADSPLLGG